MREAMTAMNLRMAELYLGNSPVEKLMGAKIVEHIAIRDQAVNCPDLEAVLSLSRYYESS